MNVVETSFQKIIRVNSSDYAVLDEVAYYNAIYSGYSVLSKQFYEIESTFKMDSEIAAVIKKSRGAIDSKSRRKRNGSTYSNLSDDLLAASIVLKKILEKAITDGAYIKDGRQGSSCSSAIDFKSLNNYEARQLSRTLASVPCPLSRYEEQHCFRESNIKETLLNQKSRIISEPANELILWTNAEPNVITVECKGEEYILPPFSSFIVSDVSASRALIKFKKRFDFILLDPPWKNASVKRMKMYATSDVLTSLWDLCIPELLNEAGLLAIWVTNNVKYFNFIDELIRYFGFEKIATWRWLKVTKSGDPVYSLDSHHKQPFESIVFASNDNAKHYWEKMVDNFTLISTPSTIHSRKPPLLPILQALGILEESALQLELFGRYLLPRTTTFGFEAPKLQNKRYFM